MFARRKTGKGPSVLLGFDRGMGTLTGALVARLGPALRTRSAVRDITRAGEGWRVGLDANETLKADHIVLAVPAQAAAR